jgi:hypothetical protein
VALHFKMAWRIGLVGVAALLAASQAVGQTAPPSAAATAPAAAPAIEPIYWRQNLFLIPYQWSSATDPSSAAAVWLYVSKDRGAHWEKISEARPQVRAFNYHAEADGEYWFSIRTIDAHGRSWPDAPMQAELKVIVDTTIPRFGDLSAARRDDGTLEIHWQATDDNLDAGSCKLEARQDDASPWQPIPVPNAASPMSSAAEGKATWQLPSGGRAAMIRATIFDRAGNRAINQTSTGPNSTAPAATVSVSPQPQWPTLISGRGDEQANTAAAVQRIEAAAAPPASPVADPSPGWVSSSAPAVTPRNEIQAAAPQLWPADNTSWGKRSASTGSAGQVAGAEVTVGKPRDQQRAAANDVNPAGGSTTNGRFVAFGSSAAAAVAPTDSAAATHSPFAPLEPFRERSAEPRTTTNEVTANRASSVSPKWVNSRTFALEYQIENIGEGGVSKVELWGTRDSGLTWRSFAIDDDNRSPLTVTVDDEGLYGFRIIVEAAGEPGGHAPRSGDRPELWVGVDLRRPKVELTAAEAGSGDLAGRLILRWQASDTNLEPRPIGLFYSSRPGGPWSTIATSMANTGRYDWQLERHLPPKIYLRVEARDLAGNLAAFQTSEPVTIDLPPPTVRPGAVEPLGPTANGAAAGFAK